MEALRKCEEGKYKENGINFIKQHLDHPSVYQLVLGSFLAFFRRNVMQYESDKYPVYFNGSIAWHFQEVLQEAASQLGINIGEIVKSPMEGLIKYFS